MRVAMLSVGAALLTGCGEKTPSSEQFVAEITASEPTETVAESSPTGQEPEEDSFSTENPYEDSQYELLDGESVEEYLRGFGMEETDPVCYYDLEGEPKLKLYFDRETGQGCGLKYEKTENGTLLLGFEISGYYRRSYYWNFPNPYSTQIQYGEDHRIDKIPWFLYEETTGLEETYTYDAENRLCAYQLRGCIETPEGESKQEELFMASFYYREDDTLQEKVYQFNEGVFGNKGVGGNQHYIYDELERLLYVEYEPYTFEDCYLIYEGDSMIPTAYFQPFYSEFVRLEEQDYHNRIEMPRDGVEAFLSQVGLSMEDKLHEYQWHNESSADTIIWSHSDVALTLYYDPERELGCGYLDHPGEMFTDMSGFMFKGCVEIDCRENDPYGVFALYEGDSMDEIYLSSLSPEELPDAFGHESLYICEYDGEKLMRIWMYGTGSDTTRFFIYEGGSDMPSYCLNLVSGFTHGATLFKFVY